MRHLFWHHWRASVCLSRFWRHVASHRARPPRCGLGQNANLVMIRVILPQHLRTLAGVGRELTLVVNGPVTQQAVLDALERQYPMLRGTIRDHHTQQRQPFIRFFVCGEDWSHEPTHAIAYRGCGGQ